MTTETADKSQQLHILSNSETDVCNAVVSPEIDPGDQLTPVIPALIFAAPDIAACALIYFAI